jgi:hypothetical protein
LDCEAFDLAEGIGKGVTVALFGYELFDGIVEEFCRYDCEEKEFSMEVREDVVILLFEWKVVVNAEDAGEGSREAAVVLLVVFV